MNEVMNEAIETLKSMIILDYFEYQTRTANASGDETRSEIQERMFDEFADSLACEVGNKYIKIVKNNSVWGFVVNTENDKKFKFGDILKPASYKAPARNQARGNVFEDYSINWTGPNYL